MHNLSGTQVHVHVGRVGYHKRSLTHHPSSQGWASRCPIVCMFVLFGCGVLGLGFLFFSSFMTNLASALYTCIFM